MVCPIENLAVSCDSQLFMTIFFPCVQAKVDLFASKPASSPPVSSSLDFFATPDPIVQRDKTSSKLEPSNTNAVDPFAAVPLNSFDGSDLFGAFTSNTDASSTEATKSSAGSDNNLNGKSSAESKPPPNKDNFQVKSGIWADSLSRGLIDLNISARKLAFLKLKYLPFLLAFLYVVFFSSEFACYSNAVMK